MTSKFGRNGSRMKNYMVKDHCKFELSAMSNTSAVGAFVINTYLLSTSLCSRWSTLANLYNRWRIRKLKLTYVSQLSTTINGRVGLAIATDADSGTPTSFSNLIECEQSLEATGYATRTFFYTPRHEDWLWTGDLALNEDRLEYPGLIYIASGSFTTAGVPGYVVVESIAEFDSPCNSVASLSRTIKQATSKITPQMRADMKEAKERNHDEPKSNENVSDLAARLLAAVNGKN